MNIGLTNKEKKMFNQVGIFHFWERQDLWILRDVHGTRISWEESLMWNLKVIYNIVIYIVLHYIKTNQAICLHKIVFDKNIIMC